MSGEICAALCKYTILGRTMGEGDGRHEEAFVRGLNVAVSEVGMKGLLSKAFSSRTLGLTGALSASEQPVSEMDVAMGTLSAARA